MTIFNKLKTLFNRYPVFVYSILFIAVVIGVYFFWNTDGKKVVVNEETKKSAAIVKNPETPAKEKDTEPEGQGTSPISGIKCANYNRRPVAVMMAGDSIVRPLSGIGQADLVFEMPVITSSITRQMAVFSCNSPEKIGSIRSARHNFIPLAQGLDAVMAHWGGSIFALEKLNAGVMDNIDALSDPYSAFFRTRDLPSPYNGFTSTKRLLSAMRKFRYRMENKFTGYPHLSDKEESKIKTQNNQKGTLTIGYPGVYRVKYEYDPISGSYFRFRGGTKEIDKLNNKQVEVKNIAIMRARSYQILDQYNNVEVEGENDAMVYRLGEEIKGKWKKDEKSSTSKLFFFDKNGKEIKFAKGPIWIQVVQPEQSVSWSMQ